MITGEKGKAIIKEFEGLPEKNKNGLYPPYICPTGYPTLGYGSRYKDGKEVTMKDNPITLAEAEELLSVTLKEYERAVETKVKVPLTQNQFDALVSFVYNVGAVNFNSSTLLRKLNAGDYKGASEQILVWNKGTVKGKKVTLNGLVRRREAEKKLFDE